MEKSKLISDCRDGKEHFSTEKKYGVPMRRDGEIIVIDRCDICKNDYGRKPTEEEARRYEEKEQFMRERGFNV
jgi:hypothetical protein